MNLQFRFATWPRWAVAASVLGLAQAPRAEEARGPVSLRIDPAAELPFTSAELNEAISLRVDRNRLAEPAVLSIARSAPGGSVCIGVGQGRCDVALDVGSGPAAVRMVALLAADLLESQTPAPDREPDPPPSRAWGAGLVALGAPGGEWGDGRFEGHLEVRRRFARRWWATAGAGYSRVTRAILGQSVVVDSIPAKAGLGLDLGWGELRAAASLRVQRAGATSGVLYGGWLEARPSLRTAVGRIALVLAIELATERLEVRPRKGAAVFTNGYATPWVGLALSTP